MELLQSWLRNQISHEIVHYLRQVNASLNIDSGSIK